MKTQLVILAVALVYMQVFTESDAYFWTYTFPKHLFTRTPSPSLLGKSKLRNWDQFNDLYESDLSSADLKFLQKLLR
uniref:Putative NDBP n=1 Tax=Superstitionia donensis TaxID=311983 RepID=A0A1V1WBL6_9SCOR